MSTFLGAETLYPFSGLPVEGGTYYAQPSRSVGSDMGNVGQVAGMNHAFLADPSAAHVGVGMIALLALGVIVAIHLAGIRGTVTVGD